jgi:hypothetical protein
MASNVLLSPADDRDYPVTAVLDISSDAIPDEYEVWQPPTIENQGATGNCVAQTLANIMECLEHQRSGEHKDYSVGYIYGTPLNTASGSGMYPREACKSLHKVGDVLRSIWECDDENPLCREKRGELPQEIHSLAKRIKGYVRLYNKEEIQRYMLRYNLPVLVVSPASSFGSWGGGYHAVAVYGWVTQETARRDFVYMEDRDLRYTNSWGSYNPKGLIGSNMLTEMWGVIPMEEFKPTDIAGHWCEKDAMQLIEKGIIKGYEDGTIRPDAPITRAEVFALLARVLRGE